ncbi:RidA family protein [Kallotenue papyrolyticum]|uniref:RidA family protein n=1 Tax=Kallotenue papyrolyticum TaxID=1325125 RepID=UPI0004786658|nr:RidA family protein [Kallotenue papyrolyticum]
MSHHRQVISTAEAPQAIGPYSQAIVAGEWVFCSGQIPLDPASGQIVAGTIEDQTRRVLDNLNAVLQAAGSSLERVVKTTIFLADMNDFATVNAIYGEYFTTNPPARSTVQVARLPRDVRVEIEAIALRA